MADYISQIKLPNNTTYQIKDQSVDKIYYGNCTTAAGTSQKDVTVANADFTDDNLIQGTILFVTFSNTNSAAVSGLTLKVGNATAKPLKRLYNASATENIPDKGYLLANQTYPFYYNGTNWVVWMQFYPIAHTHSSITTIGDYRSTATIPNDYNNKITFAGLKSKATIGNPSTDAYSYIIGLRGWSDHSGGDAHELAFNNNGINWRHGATTEWGNWYLLAHSGNVSTGDSSGQIKIAGINVTVKDIGGAAYKAADYYATKTEVNGLLAANDALVYKGVKAGADTSSSNAYGALTPAANCGDVYKVSAAGFINGLRVEVGDMLICTTDDTEVATASNYTTIRNNWNIIQTSEGSVSTSSTSSTDNAIARFDGTSGRIIQNSGAKIDDNGNIVLTSGNVAITNTDNKRLSWKLSDGTMKGYFTISSEGKVGIHGCQELYFRPGTSNNAISTETGTVLTNSAFYPYANEGLSLGLPDRRWTTLYAATNILVGNYNFTAYNTNNKPGVYIGPEIVSISQQTKAGTRGFWLIGNGQKDYARLYINALGTASTAESSPGADDGTQGAVGDVILILGNSTARGAKNTTDGLGNARGRLRLHGTTENYIDLYTQDQTTNGRAIFLPDSDHANPVLIPSYDLSGAQDLNTKYNAGIYCIEGGSVTNYPSGSTAYANLLVLPYRRPQGNTKPDFALQIYGHSANRLWFRGSDSNNWRAWRELVHVATNTGAGSTNTPVYIATDGTVTAVSKYLATHVSGGSEEIQIKYSTTIDYWWGVGTSNENHGLYDNKANQWIIYAAADNNWSFTGNAATATSATTAKYTKQYYTANSTDAPLQIRSTNADVYIWQAGHATAANGTFSNHYALQYCGQGTSPDNYLILKASNGGTPTDAIKIDELGNTTFTNIYTTKINSVSNNATYINGQKPGSSAYQINDYSGTGGYFSWMRATNTWASGDENAKVGRYFSFGTLGTSFYLMGSVSTRTSNGYDHALRYNTSSGKLFCDDVEVSLDGHTHNNYLPLTGGTLTGRLSVCNNENPANTPNAAAIEIREVTRGGADIEHTLVNAPRLGFHWGSRYWGQLVFHDTAFKFYDNTLTNYYPVYASTFYGNLSGNATTATTATYLGNIGRQTSMDIDFGTTTYNSKVFISYADGSTTTNKPPSNAIVFNIAWDNVATNHYGVQMALPNTTTPHIFLRGCNNGTWDTTWATVLDSSNYTTYTVTKTGTGASGTWGISITGKAGSVDWANTGHPATFPPETHTHDYAPSSTVSCTAANVKNILGITSNGSATKWLNEKGSWTTPTAADVGALSDDTVVTNVAFTSATDNNEYPILIKNSTGSTTTAASAKFPNASGKPVTINPSTGIITATTFSGNLSGNATTLSHTLSTNTQYYISGTTLTATGTSAATFDSNLYTTTTPGELSALRYSLHSGSVEKTYITYNATDDSLDFVFV